ncbi:MAG: cache domain-containing protein, partial [Clostridia bacterium]|nr:cache domain-containing protein [Clostridia bacterium]
MGKLEKEFEELNSKTMEAAKVRIDMLMEGMQSVNYLLTADDDVRTFLTKEFEGNKDRVSVLVNIKAKVEDSLVNKDGIANVYLYSKVNDVFIGNEAALNKKEYHKRYFEQSDYDYEEFYQILDKVSLIPNWLVTEEYMIYCSDVRVLGRSGKGIFLAGIEKQRIIDILSEVCGDLDIGFAVLGPDGEILMQTDEFRPEGYEADIQNADGSYRYKNYFVKAFPSQKIGGLQYVYTISYD